MARRYYIAYGSNLNREQMQLRCPDAELVGTAFLPGYALLFRGKWNDSFLTLEPKEDSVIPVAVWLISSRDEMMLDRYEGYPYFYYKKELLLSSVDCGDTVLRDVRALVYIMNTDNDPADPAAEYIEECREGYREFGFRQELLTEALQRTRSLLSEEEP